MQFKNVFLAAAVAALTSAQEIPTLAAALNSTENLSALNTLLGQFPDLLTTLTGLTNSSIFAPSNDALEALMAVEGFETLATLEYLQALLTYHVVEAPLLAANITATPLFVPTLLQNSTYSNVTGGQVIGLALAGEGDNGTAQVISGLAQRSNITTADIEVSTGYVHIIDAVLTLPPNITTTVAAANLTGLAGALIFADLGDTLDAAEDVTVFAPTTEAFETIASAFDNITQATVASILQYHVVAGTIGYSSMLENNTQLDTLAGSSVNVTIIDGEVFVNSARVVATNVLVSGGVVHIIDAVLNPNSTNVPSAEGDQSPSNFEDATAGEVDEITDLVTSTVTSVIVVPTAAPVPEGGAGAGSASTSTEAGAASMPTGAIGAAALFGGMAILAQF